MSLHANQPLNPGQKGLWKPKSPVQVHLELTRRCNLNCFYCTIRDNTSPPPASVPFDRFRTIIDKLTASGVFDVTFFGGEPFLNPHIYKLAEYAKQQDLATSFLTNGTIIRSEDIGRITKFFDAGTIALNGLEVYHDWSVGHAGMFQKSTETLEKLCDLSFPIGIDTLVSSSNVNDMPAFLDWVARRFPNLVAVFINFYTPFGGAHLQETLTEVQMNQALKVIDDFNRGPFKGKISLGVSIPFCVLPSGYSYLRKGCAAGWISADIDALGNVRICPWSSEILGNLFTDEFSTIWQESEGINRYRSLAWLDQANCVNCSFLYSCLGGCKVTTTDPPYSIADTWRPHVRPFASEKADRQEAIVPPAGMNPDDSYAPSQQIRLRKEHEGNIIYLRASRTSYWCNDVGAEVVRSLVEGNRLETIYQKMLARYDGNETEIRNGVNNMVSLLLQLGVVRHVDSQPA